MLVLKVLVLKVLVLKVLVVEVLVVEVLVLVGPDSVEQVVAAEDAGAA